MELFGYECEKCWDYENGFYLTSPVSRIAKSLAHYEIYKKIINLPGHIVECGVFKGASLIRLATFRSMYENESSRKIIGFDAFGLFPRSKVEKESEDNKFIDHFESVGGDGIPKEELEKVFKYKGIANVELIKGDILKTLPEYTSKHPELKISLLHIDVDVYEPTKVILNELFDKVVKGGVIMLDDYGTVAGETMAVDEFIKEKNLTVEKLPVAHIPSYIVKD